MKARVSYLKPVSEIFQNLGTQNNLGLCLYLGQNWKKILGKEQAETLRPVRYKSRCLWIRLPSSCHIQEMNFQKQEIISKINHALGKAVIQEIRFLL